MDNELREARLVQARALLKKHGLEDWRFDFADLSEVPTRTLAGASHGATGVCHFAAKTILIDPSLLRHRNQFLDTVKHEIAHALAGRTGHGTEWLKIAEKVGCTKKSLSVYKVRWV